MPSLEFMRLNRQNTMPTKSITLKLCVFLASAWLLSACGGGGNDANEQADNSTRYRTVAEAEMTTAAAGTTPGTATLASGKALYNNNCFVCHGANMPTARDSARTLAAIATNTGNMGYLSGNIKTLQANEIAAYLSFGL